MHSCLCYIKSDTFYFWLLKKIYIQKCLLIVCEKVFGGFASLFGYFQRLSASLLIDVAVSELLFRCISELSCLIYTDPRRKFNFA